MDGGSTSVRKHRTAILQVSSNTDTYKQANEYYKGLPASVKVEISKRHTALRALVGVLTAIKVKWKVDYGQARFEDSMQRQQLSIRARAASASSPSRGELAKTKSAFDIFHIFNFAVAYRVKKNRKAESCQATIWSIDRHELTNDEFLTQSSGSLCTQSELGKSECWKCQNWNSPSTSFDHILRSFDHSSTSFITAIIASMNVPFSVRIRSRIALLIHCNFWWT